MKRHFAKAILAVSLMLASAVALADVRITVYDDGLSCPGECDAHVVFHPSMNGTQLAHDPGTKRAPFKPCVEGHQCKVCIKAGGRQCFVTTYRGAGPAANTFDLTPAFFDEACRARLRVAAVKAKCAERARAAETLKGAVSCIRSPDAALCEPMMKTAVAAQKADRAAYDQCTSAGQDVFNAARPVAARRSIACTYESKGTGGPNSHGRTWRRLLPGACRTGTFVGRDGLDCCSGEPLKDGLLGTECQGFYVKSARG